MADRAASVVRVERVVLLEVKNKVGHADEDAEDPSNAGNRKRVKDSWSKESGGDDGQNGRRPA
jgi:hypothetical protein